MPPVISLTILCSSSSPSSLYTEGNDRRKSVSLRTKNQKDAIKEAESIIPLVTASSTEIVAAHVQHAKGWARKKKDVLIKKNHI